MKETMDQKYHIHISSQHRWFDVNLKEVWRYRDLIIMFTKRNFQLTYKQTILGPIWVFLNPFITSVIFTFIFGGIAGIETDGIPHILFYLCSNAIWAFFANCVSKNASTFTSNAGIFGKVYFPRLAVPVSNMLSSIIQFLIQMTMVLGFLAFYCSKGAVSPNWFVWPLIPVILLHLGLMGLGFGIIISSLTTKYRDLSILVGFGVQLWMYATPIVYPISQLGKSRMKNLLMINPVTGPIELFRYALLGRGTVEWRYLVLSWSMTICVLIIGIALFNRIEKTFMDTV